MSWFLLAISAQAFDEGLSASPVKLSLCRERESERRRCFRCVCLCLEVSANSLLKTKAPDCTDADQEGWVHATGVENREEGRRKKLNGGMNE